MLTPEQIKGRIKNIAEKKDLRPQEVLQMFLFERVLERLSASEYKSNFILKGGLLISSMIGISERTTMDMDTTVRGIQMEEDEIVEIVKKIIAIDVDDGIQFEFQRIEPIREDDAYNNFRIHLIAKYGTDNEIQNLIFLVGFLTEIRPNFLKSFCLTTYKVKRIEDNSIIDTVEISQDKNGIDKEDRVQKLKNYLSSKTIPKTIP